MNIDQTMMVRKWENIGSEDVNNVLYELVENLRKDYRQELSAEDMTHVVKSLAYKMTRKYKSWTVADLVTVFERGKCGQFGTTFKLTVAYIEMWLHKAANEVYAQAVRESQERAREYRNKTTTMLNGIDNVWGDALSWKLKQAIQHTGSDRVKIASISLDDVILAIKANTTSDLLRKTLNA